MLTIFWNASGMFYTKFLTKRFMMNFDRYCATLRPLKKCIRRIRSERSIFLLHHDNARPYCSAQTQDVMGKLKFTMVPQPPYSPNLAPLNLWLLPKLKETLKDQFFQQMPKFRQPYSNGYAANQNVSTWTE
ncbi:hypothetical protein TNCV_2941651 [Trichonephila clavipes]|nr:hypothetical protein TNCV_2941651 [Trichonephila clavipes]